MTNSMTNSMKLDHKNLLADKVIADLDSLALIEISGHDAQSFLQGQLSNDIDAIDIAGNDAKPTSQLNAYCNPKGRTLAMIRLLRHADGFWLFVPAAIADSLIPRLKMYVMRDKVDIVLRTELVLRGLINGDDVEVGEGIERVNVDGIVARQILVGEKTALDSFARASGYTSKGDDHLWRLADILSGIPQVYPQTVEAFIPQMINLDLVDGVSFTKGCYPGQEIVARLRYLGKVKQRMLAGSVSGIENLAPGDPIYAEQRGEQKAGAVVDAVQTGKDEFILSATAPANIEDGVLLVGANSNSASILTRIPLPYAESLKKT